MSAFCRSRAARLIEWQHAMRSLIRKVRKGKMEFEKENQVELNRIIKISR
jgi:hypothetical protein